MNSTKFNQTFNVTTAESDIGGLEFFIRYIGELLPYTIFSTCGTLIGILGNLLIIGAVICTKELHNPTNMLIFNLALADLTISGFVDSFTVVGILVGKNFFDHNMILCHIIAAICLIACETSLMNIGFLAINRFGFCRVTLKEKISSMVPKYIRRYIHICHQNLYEKAFTVRKTILYCAITWVIGFAIDLPNVLGWGGHYYDLKTLNCVWNRLASQSYSIFFPMSSIIIPCVCIFFCYLKIFMFASKIKNRVAGSHKSDLKRSLKIAKGLFASFMLFTVCWLPYGMIVMLDYADRLPSAVHAFAMLVAHLNSSLNPLLYAIFNPSFQRGYKTFLSILCLKRKAIEPVLTISTMDKTNEKAATKKY
nr:G protein-coupled receptor [Proales similis]